MPQIAGQAFNMGGGPAQTISLLELLETIGEITGRVPAIRHEGWRTGDQRYYVSDTRKFHGVTGWQPQVPVEQGVRRLCEWLRTVRPAQETKPSRDEATAG
jgi:CDP-paratose 2-epimerase